MSLQKLKESKIEEVRKEIKAIHEDNTSYGTYEGRLSDHAAKKAYEEILNALHEIPGLSIDDIIQLEKELKQRINTIGKYSHHGYNIDNVTNEEDFRKAVEQVHYEHRYDAGAMFGTLTAYEAEKDYNILLELLNDILGLTEEFKTEMRALIRQKIDAIPEVEKEKLEELEAYEAEIKKAFDEAKERFNSLGYFQKLKLKKERKDPEQIDIRFMGVKQIDSLYRK